MTADVAMTKRGFGEMAITGCIAGPIFNVLVGLGLSNTLGILKSGKGVFDKDNVVNFSLYSQNIDPTKPDVLNK
jgi:Ca2+/Na+ antiporter